MDVYGRNAFVQVDETLGITADEWVVLRLAFEVFNNPKTKVWAATNPQFTKAILHLNAKIGFNKICQASAMLREERRQAHAKEQQ